MNKAIVGKNVEVQGYGTLEGKTRKVLAVAIDSKAITLRFIHSKTGVASDKKFDRNSGRPDGSKDEAGYQLSKEQLAEIFGSDEGGKKREKKEKVKKERAPKEPRVIPASDWHPERCRHFGKVANPADDQIRLRVSSRGYFSTYKLNEFSHTKGESAAKKSFVDAWRNCVDKRWIYVFLNKEQAEYLWSILPKLLQEWGDLGLKGGGYRRTFRQITANLKAKFGFEGDPIAEAKAANEKSKSENEDKKGKSKSKKQAENVDEVEESEDTDEVEEDENLETDDVEETDEEESESETTETASEEETEDTEAAEKFEKLVSDTKEKIEENDITKKPRKPRSSKK